MLCISQRLGLAAKYQTVNTCIRTSVRIVWHRGGSRGTCGQLRGGKLACCACRRDAALSSESSQAWPAEILCGQGHSLRHAGGV